VGDGREGRQRGLRVAQGELGLERLRRDHLRPVEVDGPDGAARGADDGPAGRERGLPRGAGLAEAAGDLGRGRSEIG
jgi:hypothetical protein